jgi:ubiquitin-conjugating enzyme E2 R
MYQRKLMNELKALKKDPVPGFIVRVNENNLREWGVVIMGPQETLFETGVFPARLSFPEDYPFSPPKLVFTSAVPYHPNVYENGEVCISILHTPDPLNPEEAGHCWSPVQRVETILLSVISMLSDPNLSSPANVDAGVAFRKDPERYMERVLRCVEESRACMSADDLAYYDARVKEPVAPITGNSTSISTSSTAKSPPATAAAKKRKTKRVARS